MKALAIRPWQQDDLPIVREVIWKSWEATYAAFVPEADLKGYWSVHYSLQGIEKMFHDSAVDGFVAESGGRIVGCLRTRFDEIKQMFYVVSLYLLPEEQRKGIGKLLMAEADKCATTYGLSEIWVAVMVQNQVARRWYEHLGFRFIREEPFFIGRTSVPHLVGFRKIVTGMQKP